ncbi:hypothetical protein [Planotetraspora mira]|uniref:Uncharacterized protein n=1 Tax=Planotetraspora mira TaxID=58121 RepID=A0A8J3X4M6_9ACTN|nr:hypothetical protein [Planotetraspora mira]GII27847.1 hypothetical protein Pmi06nite_12890 [Planotetraspora mira]
MRQSAAWPLSSDSPSRKHAPSAATNSCRVETEQQHWDQLISRGQIRVGEDEAYKTFIQIVHVVIDPMAEEEHHDPDFWTKPLGELGDL